MSTPTSESFAPSISKVGLFLHVGAGTVSAGGAQVAVAAQDVALTASATNRVYLATDTNTVTVTTSAFPASNCLPIATVVTNNDTVTAISDNRPDFFTGLGAAGPTGATGPTGPTGPTGAAIASSSAPASATGAGVTGTVAYDSTHIYVCLASGSWVRAVAAAW